jgi:zinc protease
MKRTIIFFVVALVAVLSCPAPAQQSEGSRIISQFTYPTLSWSVPEVGREVRREILDNGMILYLMENHRLPILDVTAMTHCGYAYEPLEKMVLPDIAATVMRTGGTTAVGADSLNTVLEMIGGGLETTVGDASCQATLNVMAKDAELGLRLLADMLRNPTFPDDKIELKKTQLKTDIKRRNDNPQTILGREFYHLIYGDHPSGRILEWKYVAPITRQELVDYHHRYFVPNNMILGITGDFNAEEMIALVKKYFGDWAKADVNLPEIPKVNETPRPGMYQVIKEADQTGIRFGSLGIDRDSPDRYAAQVMNYILGGGSFASRMTSKVRSDEGLSYSVGTTFEISARDRGVWYAFCQTKSQTTYKAMDLMLNEVKRIRDGYVDEEELESAKDSYINRFVFDFTTPSQIVNRLMEIEFNQRPPDLLKNFINNIRKVTKDDVHRVAQKYLKPENITFVVVGNPEKFEKPLSEFGTVTNIELQEPVVE